MTKSDLEKEVERLRSIIKKTREDYINEGFKELIVSVVRDNLTFEQDDYNDIAVRICSEYIGSFSIESR